MLAKLRHTSVLAVLSALVVFPVAGCAPSATEEEAAAPAVDGIYRAEGDTGPAEIAFHEGTYRLLPDGCDAPECEEHGRFAIDGAASVLRLEVDGGRAYTMPFTVLESGKKKTESATSITPSARAGSELSPSGLTDEAPTRLLDETGVVLATRIQLGGNAMALVQDLPDCRETFGMGTSQDYPSFAKEFERATQFKVRLRHIPGCFEPTQGVYACTSYDAYFKSWDGSDGTAASCSRACNQPNGFTETARRAARKVGSSCLAPDNYPFKKKRAPGDDSLDMVRASFVGRGGELVNGSCRCVVNIRYTPQP